MQDLLQPRTDAGVLAQFVLLLLVTGVGVWFSRRQRDLLLLVLGLFVFAVGLFAMRAAH